jgi:hypothetical protein
MIHENFKLVGSGIIVGFANLKQILPILSEIKVKTKNNSIILGKWHKKK